MEANPLLSGLYEEKVLGALLKACLTALEADSGSIMTLDRRSEHLHIKVASKMNGNVDKEKGVKMGEGIAGVAAQNAEAIILPKDKDKEGLSKKMKRDNIKSSIIMPFNKWNNSNVYGVININVVRKKKIFSDKDISLVKELVNLAGIALIPVK